MSLYATDGKCHASPAGSYNHECGKPAEFLGTTRNGFQSGYCGECKRRNIETQDVVTWAPITREGH